jgi:hypothetical protein
MLFHKVIQRSSATREPFSVLENFDLEIQKPLKGVIVLILRTGTELGKKGDKRVFLTFTVFLKQICYESALDVLMLGENMQLPCAADKTRFKLSGSSFSSSSSHNCNSGYTKWPKST